MDCKEIGFIVSSLFVCLFVFCFFLAFSNPSCTIAVDVEAFDEQVHIDVSSDGYRSRFYYLERFRIRHKYEFKRVLKIESNTNWDR